MTRTSYPTMNESSSSSAYIILLDNLRSRCIGGNAIVGRHALRQFDFLLTCVETRLGVTHGVMTAHLLSH